MSSPTASRARSLCHVHWRLGQALLPEHFERQELGLSRELGLRFAQLAPAAWGVSQIGWDDDALAGGVVRLTQLVAIMPRGGLIDLPGNARGTPLVLSTTAKADVVALYVHVLADPAYEKDDAKARDLEAVELVIQQLALSTEPGHPDAVDSLKLAELKKGADGVWAVLPGYVPPLVELAAWPDFFTQTLGRLRRLLARWVDILLGEIDTQALSIAKTLRAHECLRRSRLLGWYLTQIDAAAPARTQGSSTSDNVIAAPPFELFRRVMELYLDVHAYEVAAANEPALARNVYDHRDIAGSFEPLLAELENRTQLPHGRAPYKEFTVAGRIAACPLPPDSESAQLYWLVRRPATVDPKASGAGKLAAGVDPAFPGAIKLAATGRLETVYRHALRGVTLVPLTSVPFRHDFDPDVTFYQIETKGEEWDFAKREGKLGYVAEGPIASCETYLFWRAG